MKRLKRFTDSKNNAPCIRSGKRMGSGVDYTGQRIQRGGEISIKLNETLVVPCKIYRNAVECDFTFNLEKHKASRMER